MILPSGHFFEPLPLFWTTLQQFPVKFVECGSGSGHLLDMAASKKVDLVGFDLFHRDDQSPLVVHGDARHLQWEPTRWPLICRPDHSGWAFEVLAKAIRQGAGGIYVGLPRNYHTDLEGLRTKRIASRVGIAGEAMYLVPALKRKP